MGLLKVAEGGVHLGHLLFEDSAREVEASFGGELADSEGEEVSTDFEGSRD